MPIDKSYIDIPVGFKYRNTISSKGSSFLCLHWSPDGQMLATGSMSNTVQLWNATNGELLRTFPTHGGEVRTVAWSSDGETLASGSDDKAIFIWDVLKGSLRQVLKGHSGAVNSLAWSSDGQSLASGSSEGTVRIWKPLAGLDSTCLDGNAGSVNKVVWSPDGHLLASASDDGAVRVWDVESSKLMWVLRGHDGPALALAWSANGEMIASGSEDRTIRIWDMRAGLETDVLESHVSPVKCLDFSSDGRLLASKTDAAVRLWRCDTWETVGTFSETTSKARLASLGFLKGESVLATLGVESRAIRIWEIDLDLLKAIYKTVYYTNAKVVLVGDTGVGKSGLGLVLVGQEFQPTESTHGRHVWILESREVVVDGGRTETRETLLWDLAGQSGYRLIHQLHLTEVAVALIVFDARSETDVFAGVLHWDRALRQAQRIQGSVALPLKKLLVAARMDRGGIGVSRERLERLLTDLGFDAYFETSSKEGYGVSELREAIQNAIDWDVLPRVRSTELFQRIKDFLISQKEQGLLLSTEDQLYKTFLKGTVANKSTDLRAQFQTCIGRVESRGLIRRLSFGGFVLLQPEKLDAYASAIVNAAKSEPEGLGSIAEEDAREGRFRVPEDERIKSKENEKLLLTATVEDLLRHDITLREYAEDGSYLVFPSQFTREHPDFPEPEGKAAIFTFDGPILNIYSTLAVRLSHSGFFKKKEMWKNATVYTAMVGGTCGMSLRGLHEGSGELTLFFDPSASQQTRFQFEEYIHTHLRRRALPNTIKHRRVFTCPTCNTPVSSLQEQRRRERGYNWINCNVCETNVSLIEREEELAAIGMSSISEMDRAADARRELEAGLVSAAGEMQTSRFRGWAGASRTTVALVFTDMVGSTALANKLGNEAMGDVRRAHFKEARSVIGKNKGYEIKTIGDSLMVVFRTAVDALNFALSLSQNTGRSEVAIRAGIHVGAIEIEEEDAFGAMVNFSARVEGQGQGAEIWLSARAKQDIDEERSRSHEQLIWTEHADRELKGFPGRHSLWSVIAPEQTLKPDSV